MSASGGEVSRGAGQLYIVLNMLLGLLNERIHLAVQDAVKASGLLAFPGRLAHTLALPGGLSTANVGLPLRCWLCCLRKLGNLLLGGTIDLLVRVFLAPERSEPLQQGNRHSCLR